MKLLLDSQSFLWLLNDANRIGPKAAALLSDGQNELYISTVSIWELGVKHLKKQSQQPFSAAKLLSSLPLLDAQLVELNAAHLLAYDQVLLPQKDPFDRMLVAQSKAEGCMFITSDHHILASKYDVLDITT